MRPDVIPIFQKLSEVNVRFWLIRNVHNGEIHCSVQRVKTNNMLRELLSDHWSWNSKWCLQDVRHTYGELAVCIIRISLRLTPRCHRPPGCVQVSLQLTQHLVTSSQSVEEGRKSLISLSNLLVSAASWHLLPTQYDECRLSECSTRDLNLYIWGPIKCLSVTLTSSQIIIGLSMTALLKVAAVERSASSPCIQYYKNTPLIKGK